MQNKRTKVVVTFGTFLAMIFITVCAASFMIGEIPTPVVIAAIIAIVLWAVLLCFFSVKELEIGIASKVLFMFAIILANMVLLKAIQCNLSPAALFTIGVCLAAVEYGLAFFLWPNKPKQKFTL